VEEQDGIALVFVQRAVGLICQLDVGQSFSAVESKIPQSEDVALDDLLHGW